ncbi:MAG: CopD family protein [Litoreibacter sp.]
MPDVWGLASIATKFALYLGLLTSTGTVFAVLLFQLSGYRQFILAFASLGVVATLLGFSLNAAMLMGNLSGMTDPEMLRLLWSTSAGTALALRLVGLSILALGLFMGPIGLRLSMVGGTVVLWSFASTGHIPDRDSMTLDLILMFHLVAISLWIGVLSPLRKMSLNVSTLSDAADLGHRFGKIAIIFVPLLIIGGGYMGYRLVGSMSALIGSAYGLTLILKVVFVASLLGLATANKLRFIPQITTGDQRAATSLSRSISLEWAAIAVILMISAILTSALTLPA